MKDNKLTTHANERYFDRSSQEVTRKKLINYINNGGEILYAKRLTATRSLAYIPIGTEAFKVIINRRSKRLVSILPYKDHFAINVIFFSEYYDNKRFLVKLFPDCYAETNKQGISLTKIYEIDAHGEIINVIEYSHPFFMGLFETALSLYNGSKGLIRNGKNKAKSEIKTITFKKPEVVAETKTKCTGT
jgi:hypothetical protein